MRRLRGAIPIALQLLMSIAVAAPLHAHLMPPQQATLNIRDSAAFGVFSIPVSAVRGWDDDGNGRMSAQELARHQATVVQQLSAGMQITSGRDAGRRDLVMPSLDLDPAAAQQRTDATHLLVLVRQSFTQVPSALRVTLSLFGTGTDEREILVKATVNGTQPEVAVFRAGDAVHEFFVPAPVFIRMVVRPLLGWCTAHGSAVAAGIALLALLVTGARRMITQLQVTRGVQAMRR